MKAIKKQRVTQKVLGEDADNIVNWLFGDHGPFGWNDPCDFQDNFNKIDKTGKAIFINELCSKLKSKLLEKIYK